MLEFELQDIHRLRILGPRMSLECVSVLLLQVSIREGESQKSLLRRFQRMVEMSGVLREAEAHHRFTSKRDAARMKAKNNARRICRQRH